MTRSELIAAIAEQFPDLRADDVDSCVRTILDAISEQLGRGGRIEIRDFGSFQLNSVPARTGRNPKTGQLVHVPAKPKVHFKVGRGLKARVDSGS